MSRRSARINDKLQTLIILAEKGLILMANEFEDLKAQVAASTSVEKSALVLIQGIAARLATAGNDPAAVAALTADLKASADGLAAAVAADDASQVPVV